MRRSFASLVAPWVLVGGCLEPPGEEVGSYVVTATLDATTCGPGVGEPEREFRVQIRREGETAYWIGPAQLPIAGSIDGEGQFSFRVTEQILVRPAEPDLGIAACAMDQLDVTEGRASDDLEATETLWIAQSAGADCSDRIGIGEGQLAALPCMMELGLVGTGE